MCVCVCVCVCVCAYLCEFVCVVRTSTCHDVGTSHKSDQVTLDAVFAGNTSADK